MALIVGIIVIVSVITCGNTDKKPVAKQYTFSLPTIPSNLIAPEQRGEYLVLHYWDNFPFADTTLINNAEVTEQAFVDYINLFPHTSIETVATSISSMLDKATDGNKAMYDNFVDLYDKYLYDPNSPFRQEDFYIPVLRSIINSDKIEEIEKVRPRYRLELAMKNRLGNIAADFTFVQRNGRKMKLSDVRSEYTILFFNNPDCHDCARVKELLSQYSNPKVKIVAIYPDEEVELWKKADYPKCWINGHNTTIRTENSYDLKAIPTLYLLNRDKRVVLKDAPVEIIMEKLSKL